MKKLDDIFSSVEGKLIGEGIHSSWNTPLQLFYYCLHGNDNPLIDGYVNIREEPVESGIGNYSRIDLMYSDTNLVDAKDFFSLYFS